MPYQVHLSQFEGPLDLLLHLIRKSELDISQIAVSKITGEYLALMDETEELEAETAGEFLTMAAALVYLKSRSLLPAPSVPEPDGTDPSQEEDPEQALIRQLQAYKAMKEASALLEEQFEKARLSFDRLPEDLVLPPPKLELEGITAEGLYSAFLDLMRRKEPEGAAEVLRRVQRDAFTVKDGRMHIRARLREKGRRVTFSDLFDGNAQRGEIVMTFLALLDLLSRGELTVRQETPFSPILLTALALQEENGDTSEPEEEY